MSTPCNPVLPPSAHDEQRQPNWVISDPQAAGMGASAGFSAAFLPHSGAIHQVEGDVRTMQKILPVCQPPAVGWPPRGGAVTGELMPVTVPVQRATTECPGVVLHHLCCAVIWAR